MVSEVQHRVIALISGGKDSFLTILELQKQGHEIIALANLHPPIDQDENLDLNSHMYQSAGHALIPFYEQLVGVPLYRQAIKHKTTRLEKNYVYSMDDDETKDLRALLAHILTIHPEATAVCSGAIFSTYQRTRIESVCYPGLMSLAPLWEMAFLPDTLHTFTFDQSCAMLDYFAELQIDARIVKVASGGLDPSFLWKSLLDPVVRRKIKAMMRAYEGSVIGEGGEFETIVLSGPMLRGKIIVPDNALTIRTGQGGESWVDISDLSLVKVEMDDPMDASLAPQAEIHAESSGPGSGTEQIKSETALTDTDPGDEDTLPWRPVIATHRNKNFLWLNNIHDDRGSQGCTEQLQHIVAHIQSILDREQLEIQNIIFTTVLLRHMRDFTAVNQSYKELFTKPVPAARVTISAGSQMPDGVDVMVSCVIYLGDLVHREGIHIRSISYWAPAIIGQYSQAVTVPIDSAGSPQVVYIAGQIPLVPASMKPLDTKDMFPQELFKARAELALRHVVRIGKCMKINWLSYGIAYIPHNDDLAADERVAIAYQAWNELHEDLGADGTEETPDDALDPWDLKHGIGRSHIQTALDERLPSAEAQRLHGGKIPHFYAVQVHELPMSQAIEWQSKAVTGSTPLAEDEEQIIHNPVVFKTPQTDSAELSNILEIHPGLAAIPCYRIWKATSGGIVELRSCLVML